MTKTRRGLLMATLLVPFLGMSQRAGAQGGIGIPDYLNIRVVYGRLQRNAGSAIVHVSRNGGPIRNFQADREGRLRVSFGDGKYLFYATFLGVDSNVESDTVSPNAVFFAPLKNPLHPLMTSGWIR